MATYSQTGQAKVNAISKAIRKEEAAHYSKFIVVLTVCHSQESGLGGSCRQVTAEHSDILIMLGVDIDPEGIPLIITSSQILLPFVFGPEQCHFKKP